MSKTSCVRRFVYSAHRVFGLNFVYSASTSCIWPQIRVFGHLGALNTTSDLKNGGAEYTESYSATSCIRLEVRVFGDFVHPYRLKKQVHLRAFGEKVRVFGDR